MPAITVPDLTTLARITLAPGTGRRVSKVIAAPRAIEGGGFPVHRAFAGLSMDELDPFVHLDQVGPAVFGPRETKGAPWHPHRGFETVTYSIDGEMSHRDSHGGGGVIAEGDTQWMTAGSGILHDELPSERTYTNGGPQHMLQLWVNLPKALKFTKPRYQAITGERLRLLASEDAGALVRLIAGQLGSEVGPGSTHTPITVLHATITPGAELTVPWDRSFNAIAFALTGSGTAGIDKAPIKAHHTALFGPGESITLAADQVQHDGANALDVYLIGGKPIGEPVFHYGPFVMNEKWEIVQAIEDYQAGKFGQIPPQERLTPRLFGKNPQ